MLDHVWQPRCFNAALQAPNGTIADLALNNSFYTGTVSMIRTLAGRGGSVNSGQIPSNAPRNLENSEMLNTES